MALSDQAQREIRKIAYALWMEDGQPEGRDREHWEKAKEIWAFQSQRHEEVSVPSEAEKSERLASEKASGRERRQKH